MAQTDLSVAVSGEPAGSILPVSVVSAVTASSDFPVSPSVVPVSPPPINDLDVRLAALLPFSKRSAVSAGSDAGAVSTRGGEELPPRVRRSSKGNW